MPNDTMTFVFFIYGLSFFTMGLAILVYPKSHSTYSLAPDLNLIALFGLLHGINEWLDLFILINESGSITALALIHAALLPASFLFLVIFGVKAVAQKLPTCQRSLRHLPLILTLAWAGITIFSEDRFLISNIFARYLIGLPGALLASYGLHLHLKQLRKTKLIAVTKNLRVMIAAFAIYGILAGACVKEAAFFPASVFNDGNFISMVGIPIQVFRAAVAILLAYATLQVLKIFHWETQNRLEEEKLQLTEPGTINKAMADKLRRPLHVTEMQLQRLHEVDGDIDHKRLSRTLGECLEEIGRGMGTVQRLCSHAQDVPVPLARTIRLHALLQQVSAVFSQRAQCASLNIHIDVPQTIPALTLTERELEYIVSALIESAVDVKGHPQGQQLIVACIAQENIVALDFEHTSRCLVQTKHEDYPMMSPEILTYAQEDSLSMAVVKEIVTTCGGTILYSHENARTAVRLTLPIAQPA